MEVNSTKNETQTNTDLKEREKGFTKWETFPSWEVHELEKEFSNVLLAFLLTVAFLGVIVDAIICWVMITSKIFKKNLSNYFIFHLSVTELLFLFVGIPLVTIFTASKDPNSLQCRIEFFFSRTCAAAIFAFLSGIALDRYFNIARPLKSFTAPPLNRLHAVLVVWTYAGLCSAPFLHSADKMKLESFKNVTVMRNVAISSRNNCGECSVMSTEEEQSYFVPKYIYINVTIPFQVLRMVSDNETSTNKLKSDYTCGISTGRIGKATFFIYFILAFLIPLVVMVTTYSLTTQKLWRRSKTGQVNRIFTKSKVKSLRMLVLSVISFSISWGVVFIRDLLNAFNLLDVGRLNQAGVIVYSLAGYMYYLSPIVNAALYSIYNANFRKEMKKSFLRMARLITLKSTVERVSFPLKDHSLRLK